MFTFFAFIHIFFSVIFLPVGLTYLHLFTPFFYVWLIIKKQKFIITRYLSFLFPFFIIHLKNGIDDKYYYSRTSLSFFLVYIIMYSLYIKLNDKKLDLEKVINKITVFNVFLLLISFLFIFAPSEIRGIFWRVDTVTAGLENYPRLRMFTYEPSHLASLLTPIWFFYFFKFMNKASIKTLLYFISVSITLILAFSTGVLACIALALAFFYFINIKNIFKNKQVFYSLILSFVFVAFFAIWNIKDFIVRIMTFLSGADSSGNARTVQSFILGVWIAMLKSIWFGCGPGQIKVIGDALMRSIWGYMSPDTIDKVLYLPNFVAEAMATFGIVGLILIFTIQIFLFFKTKVYRNNYRMCLFIFSFVYQFTGGSSVSLSMWAIWILAFADIFPEFSITKEINVKNEEKKSLLINTSKAL